MAVDAGELHVNPESLDAAVLRRLAALALLCDVQVPLGPLLGQKEGGSHRRWSSVCLMREGRCTVLRARLPGFTLGVTFPLIGVLKGTSVAPAWLAA